MRFLSGFVIMSAIVNTAVSAAEIHVMSGGAPKEVFVELVPQFEKVSGHKVRFTYAVITALREKLAAGEKADVLVMPVPVLQGLAKEGKVQPPSTFATVGTSVIVKQGAAKPDISSQEKFRAAMVAAKSAVHATPGATPSGTHMGKVMEQLGIAAEMAKKTTHKPALDGGVQLVASGEAEIGIYPTSEVAHVPGLTIVGPLPAGLEFNIVYGAAPMTGIATAQAAEAFVKFMAAPEHRKAWNDGGFTPPG